MRSLHAQTVLVMSTNSPKHPYICLNPSFFHVLCIDRYYKVLLFASPIVAIRIRIFQGSVQKSVRSYYP